MYITTHALNSATERLGIRTKQRLHDEALTAMIFGKRRNYAFVYGGVVFGFDRSLSVLKTVYREE